MPVAKDSFWGELWRRATALDRLTAGYVLAFALALTIFGRASDLWPALPAVHLGIFVLLVCVVWFWHDRRNGFAGFIRNLYPLILYSLFYSELETADFWVRSAFQDQQLVAFEQSLFGVVPNIWIIPAQTTWANEIMMAGYFSYYLLMPVVCLVLFLRRQIDQLQGMLYAITAAFVISYLGFVLFPVEGPRYFLADQFPSPLAGWFFVPLVRFVIDNGAIHGGCMPSSHVAVALVTLFWARRSLPRLGAALYPIVFVLILGTAWGRFHYVTDIFAGIIVGAAALALTGFWRESASRVHNPAVAERGMREGEVLHERA